MALRAFSRKGYTFSPTQPQKPSVQIRWFMLFSNTIYGITLTNKYIAPKSSKTRARQRVEARDWIIQNRFIMFKSPTVERGAKRGQKYESSDDVGMLVCIFHVDLTQTMSEFHLV